MPGTKVYLQTGDTQLNLLKALGRKMRDNTPRPITMVFVTSGSCANINLMYNHLPATGMVGQGVAAGMQYVPSIAEDPNWVQSSATLTCNGPAGKFPDIGNSALFNSACPEGQPAPPDTLNLTFGPRQAYLMVMPRGTDQTAITYEEAYFIFGFGPTILAAMNGSISPWLMQSELQVRAQGKSTLLAWAANISVPAAKMKGNPNPGSPDVVAALLASANPSAAIGILGAEVYDGLRASLTSLAFRAHNQFAAYYPDSTATSRDKKNVRDGHYTVWSPTVWMDNVDASKQPMNPDARYIIDIIAGHVVTPAPNFAGNVTVAKVGLVPDCAMRVDRSVEGGPLSLYKPAASCTCEFENAVDVSTCQTCTTTCPGTGVCRNHYCEEF